MKICLISNLYEPYTRGGAERIVAHLARGLASRGHEVHVVTAAPFSRVGFGIESRREDGIMVHRMFHWNFFFTLHSGRQPLLIRLAAVKWSLMNVPFAWRVAELLQRERFDLVHTHNLAGTSFLIPRVIHSLKIPHVHTAHDVQLAIPSGRLLVGEEKTFLNFGWPAKLFQWTERLLWNYTTVLTAPSEWLLEYYRGKNYFHRARLEVVRHFFTMPLLGDGAVPHVAREKFTIVYCGQIERAKGVLMLIELFAEINLRDAELIIVGRGEDFAAAQTAAAPCSAIQFVGEVPHTDVQKFLRTADVVVVPSLLYENSPTIVTEAFAARRPVSVSDVGGAAELVRVAEGGWVIAPTHDAWRTHLSWLLQNRAIVVQKIPQMPYTDSAQQFEKIYTNICKPQTF